MNTKNIYINVTEYPPMTNTTNTLWSL